MNTRHTHVRSKVEWLTETLGFTRDQAARAVYANPGVLLRSVEGSMMPKIRWLADALQMEDELVFDMVRRQVMSELARWGIPFKPSSGCGGGS